MAHLREGATSFDSSIIASVRTDAGRSQTRTAPAGPAGRRRLSCKPRAAQGGIQKKGLMRLGDIVGGPGSAAARGGDRAGPRRPARRWIARRSSTSPAA